MYKLNLITTSDNMIEIKINYLKHIIIILLLLAALVFVVYNVHFTEEYDNLFSKFIISAAVIFLGYWGIWRQLKTLKFPIQIRLTEKGIEYFDGNKMRFDSWGCISEIRLLENSVVELELDDKSVNRLVLDGLNRSSDSSYRLIMKNWEKYK